MQKQSQRAVMVIGFLAFSAPLASAPNSAAPRASVDSLSFSTRRPNALAIPALPLSAIATSRSDNNVRYPAAAET